MSSSVTHFEIYAEDPAKLAELRAELERSRYFSFADRFLRVPLYGIAVSLFLGIIVLRQMRREPRPLPEALVAQRAQEWVGSVLARVGAVVIYTWVGLRGPP